MSLCRTKAKQYNSKFQMNTHFGGIAAAAAMSQNAEANFSRE
jgi:hypothetical protein